MSVKNPNFVWVYRDIEPASQLQQSDDQAYKHWPPKTPFMESESCRYCKTPLQKATSSGQDFTFGSWMALSECNSCGWWHLFEQHRDYRGGDFFLLQHSANAVLHLFDVRDVDVPTRELIEYLKKHYESRFSVHPRKYEELVGAIFRDEGYGVRATSYSNDGGIDLFVLDHESGQQIGVQVKRYRDKIGAEPIRSLAGALVLNGLTEGAFVTTSSFTRGAVQTAQAFTGAAMPIKLLGASDFFEKLNIASSTSSKPSPESKLRSVVQKMKANLDLYKVYDEFIRSPN